MAAASGAGGMSGIGWMMAANALFDAFNTREQGKIAKTKLERDRIYQDFQDWASERQAGVVVAASQRTAMEERRQANLAASRALAVAASSGGGVSDPTMVDILSRIRGEGGLRASVALYEGEERARQIRLSGAGAQDLRSGSEIMAGYNAAAAGKIAREGLSLYAKYGMGGPKTTSPGVTGDRRLEWNDTGDFPADEGTVS